MQQIRLLFFFKYQYFGLWPYKRPCLYITNSLSFGHQLLNSVKSVGLMYVSTHSLKRSFLNTCRDIILTTEAKEVTTFLIFCWLLTTCGVIWGIVLAKLFPLVPALHLLNDFVLIYVVFWDINMQLHGGFFLYLLFDKFWTKITDNFYLKMIYWKFSDSFTCVCSWYCNFKTDINTSDSTRPPV